MNKNKLVKRIEDIERRYSSRLNKRYFLAVDISETPEQALQRFQNEKPGAKIENTIFFKWGSPDEHGGSEE